MPSEESIIISSCWFLSIPNSNISILIMDLWNLCLLLLFSFTGANAAVFTLQNKCQVIIWPGILSGAGHPQLMNGGLQLQPTATAVINAPKGWSGRFWARSGCIFDESGKGKCATADCGGVLQCAGAGGIPPASLAEFTLDSPMDFYDVSIVDGYNIPISISPSSGTGNCTEVKCSLDLKNRCPEELKVRSNDGEVIACKSACLAFNKPEYCCTGAYNNPNICKPTNYSQVFKSSCPTSYSFPYDDATSIFTCEGASYAISFC